MGFRLFLIIFKNDQETRDLDYSRKSGTFYGHGVGLYTVY